MTDAEFVIWQNIKSKQLGFKFRRQHSMSRYIVDFICLEKKLIIELDGDEHGYESFYEDGRAKFLEGLGYKVLRFWNDEVFLEIKSVLETIYFELRKDPSSNQF
jgi:very-short-patch-repair endonuclease